MSGIALVFRPEGPAPTAGDLDPTLRALAHRGPDGHRVLVGDGFALAHLHFRTTPEEAGEAQPVSDCDAELHLALDGRIDNRDELIAALGSRADRNCSDAAIFLAAYEKWGERCFARVVGPFAVAVCDTRRRRVVCARDTLGDRALCYHRDRAGLRVASEPQALCDAAVSLDETTAARYFAVLPPAPGATFFDDIHALPPAHLLVAEHDGIHVRRYWDLDTRTPLHSRSDVEYIEEYRDILARSVRCRMRAPRTPAVMMSGGLDSTAVAAVAADSATPAHLRTFSYVFDELTACDEREYILEFARERAIDPLLLPGDDCWPLAGIDSWPTCPFTPAANPYRRLKQRTYRAARDAGVSILLTGVFGDHLYSRAEDWLRELARHRPAALLREAVWRLRRRGLSDTARAAGRWLARMTQPALSTPEWPWLSPRSRRLVSHDEDWPPSARSAMYPRRHRSVLGLHAAASAADEVFYASHQGVDLRHPYRDRRLVEFMLGLPAHLLFRLGRPKHIHREAMRGLLPERVVERETPTSLVPLYLRGVGEREAETVRQILLAGDAAWPDWVNRGWIESQLGHHRIPQGGGSAAMVLWNCLSFELWRRRYDAP